MGGEVPFVFPLYLLVAGGESPPLGAVVGRDSDVGLEAVGVWRVTVF